MYLRGAQTILPFLPCLLLSALLDLLILSGWLFFFLFPACIIVRIVPVVGQMVDGNSLFVYLLAFLYPSISFS